MIDKFDLDIEEITPETTLEHLGLASIDRFEFMFDIENEFHVKIPDEEFKVTTIQGVADVVDSLILEQTIRSLDRVMISDN